jgi:arylsulfatase A-like enzyme
MVEFVDIFPTIAELAGLPVPGGLEGASAVPLLAAPNRPGKRAVFSQFLRDGAWVAPDGIPYMGYSVRTDRYRYTAWMNWTSKAFVAWELYDHTSDPDENVNVVDAPEYARTRTELEAMRVAGWKAVGRDRP